MNKTISANISGIVFNIEENAYEVLYKYLSTIRGYFKESDGRDEILADIEARIAELFGEKINERKNVINMADVEEVIGIMGQPEQYLDEDEAEAQANQSTPPPPQPSRPKRRIFRDPDNQILGGVCSGASHYFGWDPLWLRLFFVGLFFILGTGFLLYIVLWVLIPKAQTTAEKLEMRGEDVNVDNIGKTWSDKMSSGLENFEKGIKDLDTDFHADRVRRMGHKTEEAARGFWNVFSRFVGVGFILAALGMIVLLVTFFVSTDVFITFADDNNITSLSYGELSDIIFTSSGMGDMAFFAIILLIGVPIIYFMIGGIKLLFGLKGSIKGLSITFTMLWIAGVILGALVGIDTGKQYASEAEVVELLPIHQPNTDTLTVDIMDDIYFSNYFREHDDHFFELIEVEDSAIILGYPFLDVVKSDSDTFQVEIIRASCGPTHREAIRLSSGIEHKWEQPDSTTVRFAPYFKIDKDDRFRGQHIKILVKVPEGKAVKLNPLTDRIIYHEEHHHHYDYDDHHLYQNMTDKIWTMTPNGLECIDCP